MLIIIPVFLIILGHGHNKKGILSYDTGIYNTINGYIELQSIQTNQNAIFTHMSNNTCYIMLENNTIISTGDTYKLEGNQNPYSQIYQTSQLNGKNIIQMSLSDSHGIARSNTNKIYTFGSNANGQLGRVASATGNSFGEVTTLPNANDTLIAVGAVQQLSFLVYQKQIYVLGQCSHGLCGNALGYIRKDKITTWEPIDLSSISDINITNVHFGPLQLIIYTADGNVYYLGDNTHQQACGSTEQYQFNPLLIPIRNIGGQENLIRNTKANGNVLAFLTNDSKIYYCGCSDVNFCGVQTQTLTLLNITDNGQPIEILDFNINYVWQLVTPDWVGNYTTVDGQISKYNLPKSNYNMYWRISHNSYASIVYQEYRGVIISLIGGTTLQIPINFTFTSNKQKRICYSNYQNFFCPISPTFALKDQDMLLSVEDSGYYPVNYQFTFTIPLQTIQIPIYPRNKDTIIVNITLSDQNNQKPSNSFILNMINKRNGIAIFDNQTFTRGLSVEVPFVEITLMDQVEITIVEESQQPTFFPINITVRVQEPYNLQQIIVKSRYSQIIQFMLESTTYITPNYMFNITVIFPSQQSQTSENQTSDAKGQYTLIFGTTQFNYNQSIILSISGKESQLFKMLEQNVTINPNNLSIVTIYLQQQFQMVLTVLLSQTITGIYHILDPDTNKSCYSTSFTNQNSISAILPLQATNWQCNYLPGSTLRLLVIEDTQTYFAVPIIFQTSEYIDLELFLYNISHTVTIQVLNQHQNFVNNHEIEYRVGDNITWQTGITNYVGKLTFQVNLSQLYFNSSNPTISVRANEATQYDAIPEQVFNLSQYLNPIQIEVRYYEIFNVQFSTTNGQNYTSIPNINIQILDANKTLIYKGQTNNIGELNATFYEKQGQMFPNQEYTVRATDPTDLYPELTDTFYTQWNDLYVPMIFYGLSLRFQIYDGILQKYANSVQIQINDSQRVYMRRSDDQGYVTFFVSTIVYYTGYNLQVVETDIYKPYSAPKQQYTNQLMVLIVHSWKRYDLKLIVYDGINNAPVNRAQITLQNIDGQVKYSDNANQEGILSITFTEKNQVLEENQIYRLVINDVFGIYPEFRQNYSFSFQTRNVTFTQKFYLQIQRVFVTVTDYEGNRLQNVIVNLYSNKNFIDSAVTDIAGTAYFYISYSQYSNNNKLTYQVVNTGNFRPVNRHVGIQIQETPQYVVKKLFQRIQYIFYIYINDTTLNYSSQQHQKTQTQSLQHVIPSSVHISQLQENITSDFSKLPIGVYDYDNITEKINQSQVSDVIFYDENKTEIFKRQITSFNKNLTMRFVEGYNITFKFNEKYYIALKYNNKKFQHFMIEFQTTGFFYVFTLQLVPKKINLVALILMTFIQFFLVGIGIMMIVFASREVHRLIHEYRDMKIAKGEIMQGQMYTQLQLLEEAQFIRDYVKYDEERFAETNYILTHPKYQMSSSFSSKIDNFFFEEKDDNTSDCLINDTVIYSEPKVLSDEYQLQSRPTHLFIKQYIK